MSQKFFVCAVRDKAAEVFGQPFCVPALGLATRGFLDQVNNPESGALHQHPEDFDLYCLGVYDDVSGTFQVPDDSLDYPQILARGVNAKGKVN